MAHWVFPRRSERYILTCRLLWFQNTAVMETKHLLSTWRYYLCQFSEPLSANCRLLYCHCHGSHGFHGRDQISRIQSRSCAEVSGIHNLLREEGDLTITNEVLRQQPLGLLNSGLTECTFTKFNSPTGVKSKNLCQVKLLINVLRTMEFWTFAFSRKNCLFR